MNNIHILKILMTSSNIKDIELIVFILNKKLNNEYFICSICFEKFKKFYIICKPECINYSYCKKCVYRICYERNKCPFTNIKFSPKDICLDYRKNRKIEEKEKKQKELEKILNNNVIKNMIININFN